MDVNTPWPGFTYLLFERVNPARNEARFYYVAWQPTLLDEGAVARIYGRKAGHQHVLAPVPFSSLEEAWPLIRATVRRRLKHRYRLTLPDLAFERLEVGTSGEEEGKK